MRTFHRIALSIVLALGLAAWAPRTLYAQDTTRTVTQQVSELLAPMLAASHVRDSLSRLADKATGEQSATLEEQVWQQQLEVQAALLKAADELEKLKSSGVDLSAAAAVLRNVVESGWPRYRRQLERAERAMQELINKRSAASPQERLEIETGFAEMSERTTRMYRDLVDALLAGERLGVDVELQLSFVGNKLSRMAEQTSARMVVLGRSRAFAATRLQRTPDDAGAQTELDAADDAFNRTVQNLELEISLLRRLGRDVTALQVDLIVARGTLTSAIFEPGVIRGLFRSWRQHFVGMLAARGPHWLFAGLMIVLILAGFWLLAQLTRRLVRRAVARVGVSQLLKDTAVNWSSRLVAVIGVVVVLKQLGFELGPMLAGLGIAGFVLGFALQDTFSNFAAGAMILAYHPYDIGDTIEAGGATGIVRQMSLVSTTVLTFDNQTLIVPNKKMWGDVIRNFNSQDKRRVDLMFGAGYENDVATIERLLLEIVNADTRVLKHPAPVIKLHQLADSSVNFIVRVWTPQENYWDVYWDITRAVKLRFDEEGIKIPFPQRELHVNMIGGPPTGPA
jgi:small conductance mechanosensitive channel